MEKFCSYCGAPLAEGAKFCGHCGKKVGMPSGEVDVEPNSDFRVFPNRDYYDKNPANDYTIKEQYFSYHGRLNRKRYFFRSLAEIFVFVVLVILSVVIFPLMILVVPAAIAITVSGVMLTIRRFHDLDKSGWFYLFLFVPVADVIVSLYLVFAKGTDGPNRYGPDPLFEAPLLKH